MSGILTFLIRLCLVFSHPSSAEQHPRSDVIRELVSMIVSDIAADAMTAVTLKVVAVFVALVALLFHRHNFGPQLPSALCEELAHRYETLYSERNAKLCTNVVLTFGYCFAFDLVGHAMLVDLSRRLIASFDTLDVELLLSVMQLVRAQRG